MRLTTLKMTVLSLALLIVYGCNYITYTPHSKKQQQHAKPSIVLLNYMAEFREKNNAWPNSKDEFASTSAKYKQAINEFPYLNIRFKVVDQDKMTFYFDSHIHDVEQQKTINKLYLNAYGGEVIFYKENGKFIWKTIMY